MKKSTFTLSALCCALWFSAAPVSAAPVHAVDHVVAVVNKSVITRLELNLRIQETETALRRQKAAIPPREVLETQLLERMLMEEVQLQLAQETGIRVDEPQLNEAIQKLAQQNGVSPLMFRQKMEREGVTYELFRETLRKEMIINRLKEREVDNRVQVSDAEVEAYLKARQARGGNETEYFLNHILIALPDHASPEMIRQKQQRAEQAVAALKAGQPFAQVAARFSDAADALQGGTLGWRSASRLPPQFLESIDQVPKGGKTGLLRSPAGFHLLEIQDRRQHNDPLLIEQIRARHILVRTNETVSQSDAQQKLLQIKLRLTQGAKFEELAKLNSEDGSSARGGELGWISPGDTVPEFERVLNQLKPNEVSEPIQTQFGWHLIQVLERRKQDVRADREKLQVRMEIRARKMEEAYDEWLRQLRDRTHIRVQLNEQ